MKVPNKAPESLGLRLGIVRLGPAAGKLKYTLLDKRDIDLVQEFLFEAFVEINRNGRGAHVYAYIFDAIRGRSSGKYVHNVLWERHYGGIAPGFKVVHKNGITVDNRLENLVLCREEFRSFYDDQIKHHKETLYWAAIEEMPHEIPTARMKLFCPIESGFQDDERHYECHYLPCTKIEQRPYEFSICGRCHKSRYCGPICQNKDWPWHKAICSQGPCSYFKESLPER